MSQPRLTVTLGRDGQRVERRVSVSTEMYADRVNGARNPRKRSVRDRLGGNIDHLSFTRQNNGKRLREDDGKWKHDLFEDKDDDDAQATNGRIGSQDLRYKLARQNPRAGVQRGGMANSGVTDLREKLSGPVQRPPVSQAHGGAELQRRLASVVRNSSNVAQAAAPAPTAPSRTAAVHKTAATGGEQPTVASLLQSLGLGKYLITFQAEEVDMAALRHMSDNDLKELGVPMGPRKKILLAMGARV